ncbi:MAG: hypothetical protein HW402_1064 [Dehalococcoidales bacterium]|nr:hypothetical protein [Dehalococcoidales bacterium]
MATLEVPRSHSPRKHFFYGYVIVAIAFLLMAIMMGIQYAFGVFLKSLLREFGWSVAATSGAFSLYMALHGFLFIVTGKLNDRLGPRVVMSVCGALIGLGYVLMSRTATIGHLYLSYGLVLAIGMSGGFVPLTSTVTRWFATRRGLMSGIAVSGIGAGTMIMPPLASRLILNYGWRTAYAMVGAIAFVVIIVAAQFLKSPPGQGQPSANSLDEVRRKAKNLESGGFSLWEVIRTRQFGLFSLAYFFFALFHQVVVVYLVPYASELGIPAVVAASFFIALGGASIFGRIGLGAISDRIGYRLALAGCLIVATLALVWLLVAREVWMLYLFASVYGLVYGGIVAIQSPLVADLFGMSSHGVMLGIIVFLTTLGGAIGPVMAGRIFDVTGNYNLAFLAAIGASVIGVIASTFFIRAKTNTRRANG